MLHKCDTFKSYVNVTLCLFKIYIKYIANNESFLNINYENIKNHQKKINYFVFNDIELIIRGGGIGNFIKGMLSLYQSRKNIRVYVGKQNTEFGNTIIVSGIRQKMKNVYDDDDEKEDVSGSSSVVFVILNDTLKLKLIQGYEEFEFRPNMLDVYSRCTSIYGIRTSNECSHTICALKYLQLLYFNKPIINPVPSNELWISKIKDLAQFVHELDSLPLTELIDRIDKALKKNIEIGEHHFHLENYLSLNDDAIDLNNNELNGLIEFDQEEIEYYSSDNDVLFNDEYA